MAAQPPVLRLDRDEEPRRATYGVAYPRGDGSELVFETKDDLRAKLPLVAEHDTKHRVVGRRISVRVFLRTFENILFSECNFHDQHGLKPAELHKVTFRNCDFSRTFLGTVDFYQVRFIDCRFERCDFSKAQFRECIFERCTFDSCSADQSLFQRTEIDPSFFLGGVVFPRYNLAEKTEIFRQQLSREWIHTRLRLAEQLFRSNSEIFHSHHSDGGLVQLKRAQLDALRDLWRHGTARNDARPRSISGAILSEPITSLRLGFRALNLFLTEGGTSLRNLAGLLLLLVLSYPYVLAALPISYNGITCATLFDGGTFSGYARLVLLSSTLFLGFGFTAFAASSLVGTAALVLAAGFGIFWYALLIPVLLRRVYR